MAFQLTLTPVTTNGGGSLSSTEVTINENISEGTIVARVNGVTAGKTAADYNIVVDNDAEGRFEVWYGSGSLDGVTFSTGWWLRIKAGGGGAQQINYEDEAWGSFGAAYTDLTFKFYPAAGGTLQHQGVFGVALNDDTVETISNISIAATAQSVQSEGNSGTKEFIFTVTRDNGTDAASVNWSMAGTGANPANATDFLNGVFPSGRVDFAAGETSKQIKVIVAGDTTVETNETFVVTLANPTNANIVTTTAQGTIQNDDGAVNQPPPAPSGSFSVNERSAANTVVATLAATDADGQAVSYTFQGGGTTSADGRFKIVGNTIQVANGAIEVTVNDTQSYNLVASDGSLTASGSVAITVNNVNRAPDAPSGSFNVNEGTAVNTVVTTLPLTDADGQTVTYQFLTGGTVSQDGRFKIVGNQIQVNQVTTVSSDSTVNYGVRASDGTANADGSLTITIKDVPPSGQTLGLTLNGADDFPATDSGASVAAFGGLSITGDGTLTLRIAFNEDHGVLENVGTVVPSFSGGQIIYLFTGTKESLELLLDNLKFNPFNRATASATPVTTNFVITLDDGDAATNNAVTNTQIDVVTEIVGNHAPVVTVSDGADLTKVVDTGPDCHPLKGLDFSDIEHDVLTLTVKFLKDHGDLVIPDGINWIKEDVTDTSGVHNWVYTFTGEAAALEVMMDVIKFDAAAMPDAAPGTIRTTNFEIAVKDDALGRDPVLEQVQVRSLAGKAAFTSFIAPRELAAAGTKVGDLTAADGDGKAFSYQLVLANGTVAATDGRFKIGADGKSIEVANGALFDFEQARSYGLKLKVTIADGDQDASNNLWFLQDVTIQVQDWVSERVTGTAGNDRIYANAGNDILSGGNGHDTLMGGVGTDRLSGGNHNDWLYGGAGNDLLYGGTGSGRDVFVFNTALNSSSNKDRILDWDYRYDTIRLENAVFKALKKTGTLSSKSFKLGAAAGDADDFIGYNGTTGDLWYDANGSKAGGQVVFANLGRAKKVFYSDFIVI
ncbi:Calx-beta domain-containing protein [Microvirga vignae]|uniref:Calx-beta domain-containing protein n=1 Tax=Microvirga vignae TaxID=1225564 RepID=UPI00069A9A2E|nr:hypothetical protein [Microvirga vignae]